MAYSKQFKEQAIALVANKGYDPSRASRELGLPVSTLRLWLAKAGWRTPAKGANDPQLPAGSATPLPDDPDVLKVRVKELEAQVRRLQMEKDILKKATAFFASQNP
jgi:transposase